MPYLIGTDEAGYAPNLGPLVISATVWHFDGDPRKDDLYKCLRSAITKQVSTKGRGRKKVPIADSKLLYKPPGGLAALERSVLALLSLLECCPDSWQQIWRALDADWALHLDELPWHAGYDLDLPLAADREELAELHVKLRACFAKAGVKLVAVRSTAVFPERFNKSTVEYGNKGEALSKLTLRLIADVLPLCAGEEVFVLCDKHGGRNAYGRLLQQQFPDPLVEVRLESGLQSIYAWNDDGRRIEVRFRMGGESFLPAALASMVSKYLRELAMRAFNDFWCCRVPDLRRTAGYPTDAHRFRADISAAQAELGIDDLILWRTR